MNQSPDKPKMKPLTGTKLTRKQQAFVNELIDNPKQSATKAVLKVYGKPDKELTNGTARVIAHENLTKPNIVMALGEVNDLLESTLVNTIKDWGRSDRTREREIAQNAVMYAHDKVHGRAKQSIETISTGVTLHIDLTGMGKAVEPTQSTT